MKLRKWQSNCIDTALSKYTRSHNHFLALATPGAGKTIMATELASRLLEKNLVDIIICFSPSSIVSQDFTESLQSKINEQFDGLMGAKGRSLTYQTLSHLDINFWRLFQKYRVFVIFDEIHHCAGSNIDNANAWGEQIILNIQNAAKYTLALTGTPWRSDTAPIVLSKYLGLNNKIICDYIYGLAEAIKDDVCRIPKIIAIDNDNISVIDNDDKQTFNSFRTLLAESSVSYKEIIESEEVMKYLISSAHKKLSDIRELNPNAAGLIIASSVDHANRISILMKEQFNERSNVVTYKENEPTNIIQQFRQAKTKWIISVGMISEGTNIPRLQVCCHLTNIKTEMHFRQTLGRILRVTSARNQEAIMYMPAEPKLLDYAYRVNQDVPSEADVVKFEKIKTSSEDGVEKDLTNSLTFNKKESNEPTHNAKLVERQTKVNVDDVTNNNEVFTLNTHLKKEGQHFLPSSYEKEVNIFGRFHQEALALGLSELA
jgi:superfamily II DNA or RNA helicase